MRASVRLHLASKVLKPLPLRVDALATRSDFSGLTSRSTIHAGTGYTKDSMPSPIVQEIITAATALLLADPWAALAAPKECTCGSKFVVLTRDGIRSPADDEVCMLCRGDVADGDAVPVDHANVVRWQADRQALVRFAERLSAETGMALHDVTAELAEWETYEGFQVALHQISQTAPTRQSAWDAAMRIWIQGPEIAALESPLVGKLLARRKGMDLDPTQVKRLTARVKGLRVYDGTISDGAQQMLDLMQTHGRDVVFVFHMKDGTKQQWRGNGTRVR